MGVEEKDVERLFIAEANFIGGSIKQQFGWDPTAKKLLIHETDDSKSTISEDSLLAHLAGVETLSGAKTFSANAEFNGNITLDTNGKKVQLQQGLLLSNDTNSRLELEAETDLYLGAAGDIVVNRQGTVLATFALGQNIIAENTTFSKAIGCTARYARGAGGIGAAGQIDPATRFMITLTPIGSLDQNAYSMLDGSYQGQMIFLRNDAAVSAYIANIGTPGDTGITLSSVDNQDSILIIWDATAQLWFVT